MRIRLGKNEDEFSILNWQNFHCLLVALLWVPAAYPGLRERDSACFIGTTDYGRASDCAPIFPSVPATSRPIFARCITHSAVASTANSTASRAAPNAHNIAGVAALAIRAESEE